MNSRPNACAPLSGDAAGQPRRHPRRHGSTLVTGDDRDFRRPGLKGFNPFKELP
jgi:hypothetical protein